MTKGDTPLELLEAARQAAAHAYAPYSRFAVGAAVETSDGRVFVGANMENASYGLTSCAEVGALQAATTAGALDRVCRIAIVGPKAPAPCGRCRQLLSEAASLGGNDIEVWFSDPDSRVIERRTTQDLLPDAFDLG